MMKRVLGAKWMTGVSISVLVLVSGGTHAAQQQVPAPTNSVAGTPTPLANNNATGYQNHMRGNAPGRGAGNYGYGGNRQGFGQGANANRGYYGQNYGPYGANPYYRPNNPYGQYRAPVQAAPRRPTAPVPPALAPVIKDTNSVKTQGPQKASPPMQTRRWMPSWLKLPGRNGQPSAASKTQNAGNRPGTPSINKGSPAKAAAAVPQRNHQRANGPQGRAQAPVGPRAAMPPQGWRMPHSNGMPPWMRGNFQQPPRGPGFNANRGPQMGTGMPRRPMHAYPQQRPMPPAWARPQMPPHMAAPIAPPAAGQATPGVQSGQRSRWFPNRPNVPDWVKRRQMPQMPEWAKKRPQMPEWAKKRPSMPEWAKNPTMPEWAKRPHMPQMPEWAKNRPQMPEWVKKPKMPDWVKKKLGIPADKSAKSDQAGKAAAKVGKPTPGDHRQPARNTPSVPMTNPGPASGAGQMPGAAPQQNWGLATPPWMRGNGAQRVPRTSAPSDTKTAGQGASQVAKPGKQSNATNQAPWWGGVVTSGGK